MREPVLGQRGDAKVTDADSRASIKGLAAGILYAIQNLGSAVQMINVAFTTLTRPANTTAYTAGDSISDNATHFITASPALLSVRPARGDCRRAPSRPVPAPSDSSNPP